MEFAAKTFLVLLSLPALALLIALASMWRGYVFSILWGWFAVPYFHAPPIGIALAIGVSLMVSMLTSHRTGNEAEKERPAGMAAVHTMTVMLVSPAACLLTGWVVTKFL